MQHNYEPLSSKCSSKNRNSIIELTSLFGICLVSVVLFDTVFRSLLLGVRLLHQVASVIVVTTSLINYKLITLVVPYKCNSSTLVLLLKLEL